MPSQRENEHVTEVVSFRIDPQTYRCILNIAERLFGGVKSKAIREALAIGLCTLCDDQACPFRRLTLTRVSREIKVDLGTAELVLKITLLPKKIEKPLIFREKA